MTALAERSVLSPGQRRPVKVPGRERKPNQAEPSPSAQRAPSACRRSVFLVGPPTSAPGVWCDVPKLDDEHSSPGTVLRNPQQVDHANKAAAPGELRRDIGEADLEHFRDDDLA